MQEIELKFQIPESALNGVQDRLNQVPGNAHERLQAHYFDTPDRRLAQARSALRLRKEGERWVQTLKAVGANTMVRMEDNQPAPAPAQGSPASIHLGLHRGGAVEATLIKTLGWAPDADPAGAHTGLVELYRTDIGRHSARVGIAQGTAFEGVVELALDIGHIQAGALSLPVHELEIELVEGHAMAVILAARDWVTQHGLWLDTRTKAHRGDRLAREAAGEALPHALKTSAPAADFASVLEQLTDAMSQVALGGAAAAIATPRWHQSLHALAALSAPAETLPALARLADALEPPQNATELARAPSTTLLCLDLFAALL